jgi:hypothetical protein
MIAVTVSASNGYRGKQTPTGAERRPISSRTSLAQVQTKQRPAQWQLLMPLLTKSLKAIEWQMPWSDTTSATLRIHEGIQARSLTRMGSADLRQKGSKPIFLFCFPHHAETLH